MLVYLPVAPGELAAWASGTPLDPGNGFAATPALRAAFGLGEAQDEEAELTGLHVAALAGLLRSGTRLVAVAEVPARDPGDAWGAVAVGPVGWASVTALFADGADASGLVADAAAALGDATLDDAWDHPAHDALLAGTDLLWHGAAEWVSLVPGG